MNFLSKLAALIAITTFGCATTTDAGDEDPEAVAGSASEINGAAALRAMTYNIKHGEESGLDLSKIAAVIRESNPDIIGLQEVDDGTNRSQGKHETDELSALTGMPYKYFGANFPFDGGQYGLAILSKTPLVSPTVVRLDGHTQNENGYEPRIAITADTTVQGETFTFVTVHASLHAEERAGNGKAILAALGGKSARAIVTGDFNEGPSQDIGDLLTGAGMTDAYKEKHSLFGFTEPASFPLKRIDFIYRSSTMGATAHAWVPDTQASDHRPVGAVIPLR